MPVTQLLDAKSTDSEKIPDKFSHVIRERVLETGHLIFETGQNLLARKTNGNRGTKNGAALSRSQLTTPKLIRSTGESNTSYNPNSQ